MNDCGYNPARDMRLAKDMTMREHAALEIVKLLYPETRNVFNDINEAFRFADVFMRASMEDRLASHA